VATYVLIVGVVSALCAWALREMARADIVEAAEQFAPSQPGA